MAPVQSCAAFAPGASGLVSNCRARCFQSIRSVETLLAKLSPYPPGCKLANYVISLLLSGGSQGPQAERLAPSFVELAGTVLAAELLQQQRRPSVIADVNRRFY